MDFFERQIKMETEKQDRSNRFNFYMSKQLSLELARCKLDLANSNLRIAEIENRWGEISSQAICFIRKGELLKNGVVITDNEREIGIAFTNYIMIGRFYP